VIEINEGFIIYKPKTLPKRPVRTESAWVRRAVLFELWRFRKKLIAERGIDILQLNETPEFVEFRLECEINGTKMEFNEDNLRRRGFRKKRK